MTIWHLPSIKLHPSTPHPILCTHRVWESRPLEPAFASGHLHGCVRVIRFLGSISMTARHLLLNWIVFISFLVVPLLPQIGFGIAYIFQHRLWFATSSNSPWLGLEPPVPWAWVPPQGTSLFLNWLSSISFSPWLVWCSSTYLLLIWVVVKSHTYTYLSSQFCYYFSGLILTWNCLNF